MFDFTTQCAFPRAGVDIFDTPYRALGVLIGAMDPCLRAETIVVRLDRQRRGHSIVVVAGTDDPDSFTGIVDRLATDRTGDEPADTLVVATVRPGGGIDDADLGRWSDADERCREVGVDLVEWFVFGSSISCPRELCGVSSRWP